MTQVVKIKDRETGQVSYLETESALALESFVVVKHKKGTHLAQVITSPKEIEANRLPSKLPTFVRQASKRDFQIADENRQQAADAFSDVNELIKRSKLKMNLVTIAFPLDRDHVLITFTADGRVDFRGLLRDLASYFRMRIELRQINSREESKVYGGLGPCGRALCCSTFLGEFPPVSIKMVKNQGLSITSGKGNGLCGRLKCCLNYEEAFYEEAMADFPDVGELIDTQDGQGEVLAIDIFAKTLEEFANRFSDDGKLTVADGISIFMVLLRAISSAAKNSQ